MIFGSQVKFSPSKQLMRLSGSHEGHLRKKVSENELEDGRLIPVNQSLPFSFPGLSALPPLVIYLKMSLPLDQNIDIPYKRLLYIYKLGAFTLCRFLRLLPNTCLHICKYNGPGSHNACTLNRNVFLVLVEDIHMKTESIFKNILTKYLDQLTSPRRCLFLPGIFFLSFTFHSPSLRF